MDTDAQESTEFAATRRRVMIAGSASVLGVAGLAACGGSGSTTATQDSTPAAAGSATGGGLATPGSANAQVIAVDKVPEGGAAAASVSGLNVIVARPSGGGDPKVFSSVCPHQGCTVAPNGTTNLKCPCHGSTFDIATGAHTGGPAPTGLRSYPSHVVDGQVVLTSTTAQAPS